MGAVWGLLSRIDVAVPGGIVAGAKGQQMLLARLLHARQIDPRRAQRFDPCARVGRAHGAHDPHVAGLARPDGRADRRVGRVTPAENPWLTLTGEEQRVDAEAADDDVTDRHLSRTPCPSIHHAAVERPSGPGPRSVFLAPPRARPAAPGARGSTSPGCIPATRAGPSSRTSG